MNYTEEDLKKTGNPFDWHIRLSTETVFKPCNLCGSRMIRIPYEVVTLTGDVICPECYINFNPQLSSLLSYYTVATPAFAGDLRVESNSAMFMFGVGATADYQPNEDLFEMLSATAACLEKYNIELMTYVNMDAEYFRGRFFVKSHIGNTQLVIAERELKELLDDRSTLIGYIRYFFFVIKICQVDLIPVSLMIAH